MQNKIVIILCILGAVMAGFLFLSRYHFAFVSGSSKGMDRITMDIVPNNPGGEIRTLKTEAEIAWLWDVLRDTRGELRLVNTESLQHDRKFHITVYYSDGKILTIEPTESYGGMRMKLDTPLINWLRRYTGEKAWYLFGKNEALWDLVLDYL